MPRQSFVLRLLVHFSENEGVRSREREPNGRESSAKSKRGDCGLDLPVASRSPQTTRRQHGLAMHGLVKATLAVLFAAAPGWCQTGAPEQKPRQHFANLEGDFDVRDSAPRSEQANSLVAQRRGVMEVFRSSLASGGGAGAKLAPNEFGLPKMFFHERSALSAPSQKDPEEIARDFLRSHNTIFPFAPYEIDQLRLVGRDVSRDLSVLNFSQTVRGVPVFHGQVKVILDGAGRVMQAGVGEVVPQLDLPTAPALTAEDAVKAAFRSLGLPEPDRLASLPERPDGRLGFRNPRGDRFSDIAAELSIFPMPPDSGRLAYRVFLETDKQRWFEMLIDATDGRLLFRHSLYVHAGQARVWKESPLKGPRELAPLPDAWLPATAQVTTGNNTDAYLDTSGNDTPDTTVAAPGILNGRANSPAQNFDFPAGEGSTGQDPSNYPAAAVTNLFYFVNVAHDYFYGLGFTEAAGNFQTDNFGRGGLGNDPVRAEAQDRLAANNSGFAPTPDGIAPLLEAGIWGGASVASNTDDLDADYDGQIVFHEYGHGVSSRLVGGRTEVSCLRGVQSGALGEGWSDYFAISFFNNPVHGAYVTGNLTRGTRRRSYEGYPFTYEDIGNQGYEVHNDGEIWAATLWDLRKTLGQGVTDRLVVNGLKLTPCNPTMIDARDAIIMADQTINAGANRTKIWQLFARHGMGASAGGVAGQYLFFFAYTAVYNAAFDLPADVQPGSRSLSVTSQPPPGRFGSLYSYQVTATGGAGAQIRYALTQGPPGMTIDPVSGLLQWTAGWVGQRVKVTVTDGQGGRLIHGFLATVDTPLSPGAPLTIGADEGTAAFADLTVPAGVPVLQVALGGGSGDSDIFLLDPDGRLAAASFRVGTSDTASVSAPKPGRWTAVILGYRYYSGVTLAARFPIPAVIPGNATRSNLSGALGSEDLYRVIVPPGATSMQITTSGGSGDVELFVKQGQAAVCQVIRIDFGASVAKGGFIGCTYDQRSTNVGNSESVFIANPQAGNWYFDLSASQAYSGVTLTTTLAAPPTLVLGFSALVFAGVQGSPTPSQTLVISNTAGTPYNWTASATTAKGGDWLRLPQTSGSGDVNLTVSVDPTSLAPGLYRGSITVTAGGLAGSPATVPVALNLSAPPVLALGASTLSFFAPPGQDSPPQALGISNTGGSSLQWAAAAATTEGGDWLRVAPSQGTGNATVRVSALAANLAPGAYRGAITITAAGAANSPAAVAVTLTVAPPVTLSSEGIVNAGSFARNRPITVNEILTLFGSGFIGPCSLAPGDPSQCPVAAGFPLPTQLGLTVVTINGTPAPLLVVTPGQINLVTPFGLTGLTASVVVTRGSVASSPVTVPLADQVFGVFTVLSSGAGAGIILHADGRLVTRDAPIGTSETLVLYLTGVGAVNPSIPTGLPAPSDPLSQATAPIRILFDDGEAQVLFAGPAPGFAGLYQANVVAPSFLKRRFPIVHVQNAGSISNDTSAGGPSVLDISPNTAKPGVDLTVTLRGVNFSPLSVLRVNGEDIGTGFQNGPLQTLTATIPGRLLSQAGGVSVSVADSTASNEAPSNAVQISVALGL